MNASQAKKIPLYDLLSELGYSPVDTRKSGNEVWYCSPFRNEKDASFKIRLDQNIWYDFGEGEGGNILDFVMKYKNCDFTQALSYLSDKSIKPSNHFSAKANDDEQPALDFFNRASPLITDMKPLFHFALKDYLKERGIDFSVAYKYLKELHYKVDDKSYFALGFQNISNGWELRNQFFKGCLGKKDISLIETGSKHVSAFEGFMDFVSYLTHKGSVDMETDVLVLNSTAMKARAIELIREKGYNKINTYFDNDRGGVATHELFCKELPHMEIKPMNALYMPYKDFNDFLRSRAGKLLTY